VPKILKMPKPDLQPNVKGESIPSKIVDPILPDADEDHASVAKINKWVSLADAALGANDFPGRKGA